MFDLIKATVPNGKRAKQARIQELLGHLKTKHNFEFPTDERPVKQSEQKVRESLTHSSPNSHGSNELSCCDHDFAQSEAGVHQKIKDHTEGKNPYLEHAKKIYDQNKSSIDKDKQKSFDSVFQAADKLHKKNQLNEQTLENEHKKNTGANLPHKDFESATHHSLDEITHNPPPNPEVERMKRGYNQKQMSRLQPFLKDSNQSHSATFGDLKSWKEHGGISDYAQKMNPDSQMAMPDEVHRMMPKSSDGKHKLPPTWLPVHLMPVWKYVVSKIGDDSESVLLDAIRKYIQSLGGPRQLNDIPRKKLGDIGSTHNDVFKAMKELSDEEIFKTLKTKIIDPVAIVNFMTQNGMLEATSTLKLDDISKSNLRFFVEKDEKYIPRQTLKKAEVKTIDIRKSKINRIQEILRARRAIS